LFWLGYALLTAGLCNCALSHAHAQDKGKTQAGRQSGGQPKLRKGKTSEPGGKGKTGQPVVVVDNEPAKSVLTNPRPIIVRPNEGFLALVTTPKAEVRLNGIRGKYSANTDGVLKLRNIRPGDYRLEITLDGFETVVKTISVSRGEQTVLNEPLVSRYGTLELGLGDAAAADVTVSLDDKAALQSQLKVERGKIIVSRVPTGPRSIGLSKPGHDSCTLSLDIKPGENFLAVTMKRATITLTVKTQPQAEVYVDNLMRGSAGNDGVLPIPDLAAGAHTLKVKLAGYQTVERPLSLTLERREVTEVVKLDSILETAPFDEKFTEEIRKWTTLPPEWKLVTGNPQGLRVAGDAVALVKNTSIPNLPFNHYGDFLLLLNVKFINGKGASWIVRAQDEKNYYLFELATSQANKQGKAWKFYRCREGKAPELIDTDPVLADIDKSDTPFRISLEARGNQYTLKILNLGDRGLGPTFTDDAFRYGGIGLRAINGLEMFITEFQILPRN
jgi:hypothetical protein